MRSINKTIKKEHKKINKILNLFEKQLPKNFKKAQKTFEKLRWNLEKHFLFEEKIMSSICCFTEEEKPILENSDNPGWYMECINEINDSLDENKIPNLAKFKSKLKEHLNFEDKVFYLETNNLLSKQGKLEALRISNKVLNFQI